MLPTCFPHSLPRSPTKSGAAIRTGSRRVTHQPGDSVEELSGGTEAVRGDLATKLHLHWWLIYNYSNMIQSLAQCSQPGQPSPATPRKAPRRCWCSSTLDGSSGRMGSSVVGRLTNVVVPLNSWFCPARLGLMSKRSQGLHQQLGEMHCGAML